MKFKRTITIFILFFFFSSCAEIYVKKDSINIINKEKIYSNSGFALVYNENLVKEKILKKKINNNKLIAIHPFLKSNTPIEITNPKNLKFVRLKVSSNLDFPVIYKILISEKVSNDLQLDLNNPFVEIKEIKLNKTFLAKKAEIQKEEKNVAIVIPTNSIDVQDISKEKNISINEIKKYNFTILLGDFYFLKSAQSLKLRLENEGNIDNLLIKRLSQNK